MQLPTSVVAGIVEPYGVTYEDIQNWLNRGIISVGGGGRQGKHRTFSLMEVLGVAVAAQERNSPRGCHTRYIGAVVEAFGNTTEQELLQQFGPHKPTGRMTTGLGMVFLAGVPATAQYRLVESDEYRVDVLTTYKHVKAKVEELRKQVGSPIGRNRGLVAR